MYKKIKVMGKLLGCLICGITIDLIDLTDSYILNYLILSPVLEWILRHLSYLTSNIIVYQKLDINESSIGSLGYWISYIVYVLILFGILSILKNRGIIPIVTNLDMKIFYCIVNVITNMFMEPINKIIEILQT